MVWLEIKEFIKDSAKVIIVLVIALIIMIYVFSITQVVGNSMTPTLNEGNLMIINKLKYKFADIKRGDIISLKNPTHKYLIKRVVGLPGDTIKIKDNILYINDKEYDEPYLAKDIEYSDFSLSEINYDKIPEDMYFVLGDNRPDSFDSRDIGLVKKEDIIGKISLRFWPLNEFKIL